MDEKNKCSYAGCTEQPHLDGARCWMHMRNLEYRDALALLRQQRRQGFEVSKVSDHDCEIARLEAMLAAEVRDNRVERAAWSEIMTRLTGNSTYSIDDLKRVIARLEADRASLKKLESAYPWMKPSASA